MAPHPAQPLIDHRPQYDCFIGIDSDGCAFDSMEIKQKECFAPNVIKSFGLQAVSKYARETWEFVNLYSRWRGVNRFPAVLKALELLETRSEVVAAVERCTSDAKFELERVLAWSEAVNASVADMVKGVPPFPHVREALAKGAERADQIVVSATPCEALEREWAEHGIAPFVSVIAGQEMGKKAVHLELATKDKYPPDRVLMIGDAPGDLKAARANGVHFYPIVPGGEEESWHRYQDEVLGRFLANEYGGALEKELVEGFLAGLPEPPPWA